MPKEQIAEAPLSRGEFTSSELAKHLQQALGQQRELWLADLDSRLADVAGVSRPNSLSAEERKYLHERGWLEVHKDGIQPAGYLDQRPPPDRLVEMPDILDDRGNPVKKLKQWVTGGAVGQWHSHGEALALEQRRKREPLPDKYVEECSGNPPYDERTYPVNLQQWYVRDRQRRKLAGPFRLREQAEQAAKEAA